jgi:hypothetical protein
MTDEEWDNLSESERAAVMVSAYKVRRRMTWFFSVVLALALFDYYRIYRLHRASQIDPAMQHAIEIQQSATLGDAPD